VEKKKWRIRFIATVLIEEIEAFIKEDHIDFLMIEVWRDEARAAVEGPIMVRQLRLVYDFRGRHGNYVSVHVGVKPIGGGAAYGSEKVIKSSMYWSIGYGARVVDAFDGL
jgi:hypothetical protein